MEENPENKSILDMTDEEIEKRVHEMYKDLPDGIYQIGNGESIDGKPGILAYTGRLGFIQSEIAMMKYFRDHK